MAEKEYEKVLSSLKGSIRGLQYDQSALLNQLKEVDDIISSDCPSFDGVAKKYKKKYDVNNYLNDISQNISMTSHRISHRLPHRLSH